LELRSVEGEDLLDCYRFLGIWLVGLVLDDLAAYPFFEELLQIKIEKVFELVGWIRNGVFLIFQRRTFMEVGLALRCTTVWPLFCFATI
jgi:hypothetical protein